MPYLIGIQNKKQRFSTLISDFQWSKTDPSLFESKHSISTGLLFRGCIFGVTGNLKEAKLFLTRFWNGSHRFSLSLSENWEMFKEYSAQYKTYSDEGFSMILSIRITGLPQLYLYTSKDQSFTEVQDSIITLGSGKILLDSLVLKETKLIDEIIFNQCNNHLLSSQYYSYFLCTWLSEISMKLSSGQKEKLSLGNLYYFYSQTPLQEKRQDPAIYALKESRTTELLYRLGFVDNFLIYEDLHVKTSRKIIPFMNSDFITEELIHVINTMSEHQSPYLFYGLADPKRKISEKFTFHIAGEPDSPLHPKGNSKKKIRSLS